MSQTTITLLFLVFAVVSFILEKIPLGLTATIVALGLNLTGVLDTSATFAGYVNSNVILCIGMFVVGQALFETGMANKIGRVVTKFAKSERMLIVAVMSITGLMSGFLSNTGTAAVLIPVVCGIPMLAAGIVFYALVGYHFLPDGKNLKLEQTAEQKSFDDVPAWKQYTSLVVLVIVVLAMIFEDQIGIKLQVTACIGACVLVLAGVISEKDALKSIDLKVVLLFGGSLALANALESTGAGNLIAKTIVGALGADPNPILLLLVIFVVGCALTNFMSNTATTALMVPIATSLANIVGADPRSMIIATVIACSCAYATPIGMPANTMVVGLGGYKFKDYVKAGMPMILIAFVICMVLLLILFPFYG